MINTLAVLITYFNEREILTQTLKTLMLQEPAVDEILIYDDASFFPAKDYIPKGLSLEIVRSEKRMGPSYGRNLLLKKAKSSYIHFHDADDLFLKNWSKYIYEKIKENPDLIITEIASTYKRKLLTRNVLGLKKLLDNPDLIKFCIENCFLTPSSVIKKEKALAIGGFDESLKQSEDYDFYLRLAMSKPNYNLIYKPLILLINRDKSWSDSNKRDVWISMFCSLNKNSLQLINYGYKDVLSKAYYICGMQLFKLSCFKQAHQAFKKARRLDSRRKIIAEEVERNNIYKFIAKYFSIELAESLGWFYRKIIPQKLRLFLNEI